MTYLDLIKHLTAIGAASPTYEAAEIVRVLYGKPREWCMQNRDAELPSAIDTALQKRAGGIPLQYILGEAWFWGNRFVVSSDCLIPQPDTEHCVSLSLKHLAPGGRLLDICTGSGCIAISILKENVSATAAAIDISEPALTIAKQNAEEHGVSDRLALIKANVLVDDISEYVKSADVIVSNPPYINSDIIDTLSAEVLNEPRIALDGGDDGMIFYRHFINSLAPLMKPSAVMILEIGYDQSERVSELCKTVGLSCTLHRDFGGNIRVAIIRCGNPDENE